MTTIYFIRHAQPDRSIGTDATYPLSKKGLADVALVTAFLRDKNIDTVLSSPYKRAHDSVADFAAVSSLPIELIDDFRERAIADTWLGDEGFNAFTKSQWDDFSYKMPDGECLSEVQIRNIAALKNVLSQYEGKNIAVGTHGTALSMIIHHYAPTWCLDDFRAMQYLMPWAVKMTFDGQECTDIETIDLFTNATRRLIHV